MIIDEKKYPYENLQAAKMLDKATQLELHSDQLLREANRLRREASRIIGAKCTHI